MIFYFSGTGNSLQVARNLSAALNEPMISMAEAVVERKSCNAAPGENIGLVFPTYGWDLPAVVREFISGLRLQGPHYTYFVTTCGDDTGCLLRRTREALAAVGTRLDSAWAVCMPNTYVCLPGFDVDSAELCNRKLQTAVPRLHEIVRAVRQHAKGVFDTRPGRCAWLKTYLLGTWFRRFLMSDHPFHATDACTTCGLCRKKCPMHNIVIRDRRPQWNGRCTMCLACYHHCPHHAIAYGRFTRKKGQYLMKEAFEEKNL